MKSKQFHEMTTEELEAKLKDLKQELFNLRFQHATGQLTNPLMLKTCKRDIARSMTILHEKKCKEDKIIQQQQEVVYDLDEHKNKEHKENKENKQDKNKDKTKKRKGIMKKLKRTKTDDKTKEVIN